VVGCFLGFVSFPANIMLSDSGTEAAMIASAIGMYASSLCCSGGILNMMGCQHVDRMAMCMVDGACSVLVWYYRLLP
jgi:hypothetical protein